MEAPKSGAVGSFWEKLADVYYTIPNENPRKQAIFKLERQIIKKREEKKELKDNSEPVLWAKNSNNAYNPEKNVKFQASKMKEKCRSQIYDEKLK